MVQEREANSVQKDQQRLAEEDRYRVLTGKEQHRNVGEQSHRRDQAPRRQQWQQKETRKRRVKDEQKEFRRTVVDHYRGPTERERRNNTDAAFGTPAPHQLAGPTSVLASSRPGVLFKPDPTLPNTRQRVPVPYACRKKSGSTSEEIEWIQEEEWARRAEERASRNSSSGSRWNSWRENDGPRIRMRNSFQRRGRLTVQGLREVETRGRRQTWAKKSRVVCFNRSGDDDLGPNGISAVQRWWY